MRLNFMNKLSQSIGQNNSLLCLGLDPDPITFPDHFSGIDQDPKGCLIAWGRSIIEKTSDLVCCYKPNFAFYEQFGPPGLAALRHTIKLVPDNIPVLLDAKRGDIGSTAQAYAQPLDRISFNDQELFLNGGNVAWVNFARDIGPGQTNLNRFAEMFQQLHDNGGNAMRLWLHTTGAVSPEWSGSAVVGPGVGAIDDLRAILDLAWEHEIGMMLCLWSFDMLRISNGTTITDRAYGLLTNPSLTQTYIDNALVPMVEALADHPAIIAWEIFNEPEGMSNEHGWSINRHVPMSDIQRFINRTAGAIHNTAPEASVTNGSWAFIASTSSTST